MYVGEKTEMVMSDKISSKNVPSRSGDATHQVAPYPPSDANDVTQTLTLPRSRSLTADPSSPSVSKIEQKVETEEVRSVEISPARSRTRADRSKRAGKKHNPAARLAQERCRQMCLALFFDQRTPVHSIGFTSSFGGEGKTFLSAIAAEALARDSKEPVSLIECNWEHPTLHEYYGFPATPGLAEWLRGECDVRDIRHQVSAKLSIIPAGNGQQEAVRLLQSLRQKQQGLSAVLGHPGELLIVDLPPIISSAYGPLAATLVESLLVVVRAGATPEAVVTEACSQLKGLPIHGLILNRVESRIPGWLRQIL